MPIPTEQKKAAPTRPLRKWLVLGIAAICLLLIVVVVKRVRAGDARNDETTSGGEAGAVYAAVAPVKRETIANSLSIAGQFMPYQNVELHAKVAGYIKNIYVDIGDRVHTGKCWPFWRFRNWWRRSTRPRRQCTTRKRISSARSSDVSRAEADNVALHANAERLVNTDKARPGLIAQQELDDATAKDRASQAQVDAAKSALAAAEQQLEVAKADQQHYSALSDYATHHRSLRRRGDLALMPIPARWCRPALRTPAACPWSRSRRSMFSACAFRCRSRSPPRSGSAIRLMCMCRPPANTSPAK